MLHKLNAALSCRIKTYFLQIKTPLHCFKNIPEKEISGKTSDRNQQPCHKEGNLWSPWSLKLRRVRAAPRTIRQDLIQSLYGCCLDLVDKPVYYGVSWAMHPTNSDNTELSLRPTSWSTTHTSRRRSRTTIHSSLIFSYSEIIAPNQNTHVCTTSNFRRLKSCWINLSQVDSSQLVPPNLLQFLRGNLTISSTATP